MAEWVADHAERHDAFEIDFVDLKQLDLPLMAEPKHPRFKEYQYDHTKDWSARVDAADAFVFVHPEYNHGINAPLKNAIDYLNQEWKHKPIAFVGYGGVAAGTRAQQQLKQVVLSVDMHPIVGVPIPFIAEKINDDGELEPNEEMEEAIPSMLDQLERAERSLRALRAETSRAR